MKRGFTLIEILVVIAIVAGLIVFSSVRYFETNRTLKLKYTSQMIVSDLRQCQQKAITEKKDKDIIFYESHYIFSGKDKTLSKPLKIINPKTIKFSKTGKPHPAFFGTISLSNGKSVKKIVVSNIGRIRIE